MRGITDKCRTLLQTKDMVGREFCPHQFRDAFNNVYNTTLNVQDMDAYIHHAYKHGELLVISKKPCVELKRTHNHYKFYKIPTKKKSHRNVISIPNLAIPQSNKKIYKVESNKVLTKITYVCPHCKKDLEL